ncbi:MAG TPA: transporter substrate-binding domain-containing protein [Cyclobacteriaceae bacterium]|nr:transporter substrate-binding domain-containing protein [Cyclobacteriaceae bacterium]
MAFRLWKQQTLFLLMFLYAGCTVNISTDKVAFYELEEPVYFDLEEIKARGYLTALVDNNSLSYFIYRGLAMGYEYELLKLFTSELGVDLKIQIVTKLDSAFKLLYRGEVDVLAFSLAITKERQKHMAFTNPHYTTRQVLVQKKPEGWRRMTRDQIERSLIRRQIDLIGKEVHVRKNSAYAERLVHLSEEIGGDIIIIEDGGIADTEQLIEAVNRGDILYTIADEDIATVNANYYPDIDVKTPVSFDQQIAWGIRKNAPDLQAALNAWFDRVKKEPTYNVIYNRYFNSPRSAVARVKSDYSSLGSVTKISVYDDIIKTNAKELDWDWRLLAAIINQESKFNPHEISWAGATGLMQLMPETGQRFGAQDLFNPRQNIRAGARYLAHLDAAWTSRVPDPEERLKFVLASYNAGMGHILDALNLAGKFEADTTVWDGAVAEFLLKKSDPLYYKDPLVKFGYCKCTETYNYVKSVLEIYEQYKLLIKA